MDLQILFHTDYTNKCCIHLSNSTLYSLCAGWRSLARTASGITLAITETVWPETVRYATASSPTRTGRMAWIRLLDMTPICGLYRVSKRPWTVVQSLTKGVTLFSFNVCWGQNIVAIPNQHTLLKKPASTRLSHFLGLLSLWWLSLLHNTTSCRSPLLARLCCF